MKGGRGDERTSEVMLQASTREWTIGKDVPRTPLVVLQRSIL